MALKKLAFMMSWLLVGCQPDGGDDDDTTDEDATVAPSCQDGVDVDGLFRICDLAQGFVTEGNGAPADLHLLGMAQRLVESDAVLCAWQGTNAFPFFGFTCDGDLPVAMDLDRAYPFDFDSGYSAEQFGQSTSDGSYYLCTISSQAETCYAF